MQLGRSRLLDLPAQGLRRSLVAYLRPDTRLTHSSACARICVAIAFLPTASLRLSETMGLALRRARWFSKQVILFRLDN
jgi:hypothetical protein